MILVNFKLYPETFGDGAIKLAKIVKDIGDKYKIRTIVTASALDALRLCQETGVEVWLQNFDEYPDGKHTGFISAKQALALGIKGSLLNHFEHQSPKGSIQKIIKHKPQGFEIVCCVKSVGQIEKWVAKSKPDYILYEPPELIASRDKSVATADSQSIKKAVGFCQGIPLIVGAGIKNKKDVEISLKIGAKAVMLASNFVLNPNPGEVLENIAQGFNAII
jgi:triosephosphate isomerase